MQDYSTDKQKQQGGFVLLALFGGIFWGFSGTCGQFLFQVKGFSSGWTTAVRMMSSGLILLLFCLCRDALRRDLLSILRDKRDLLLALGFGVIGIMPCQYCYLTAIQYSNSGTATVLQYLGPVLIMLVVCLRQKRCPAPNELLALLLAVGGTVLIATHGNLHQLMLSPQSLFWGLASAVGYVLYALLPTQLMTCHSSMPVTGLGMLFGSIPLMLLIRPWQSYVRFDCGAWLGMAGIVLIGTVLAYTMFIAAVGGIGPSRSSLIATVEPVSATLFSVLWMKTYFAAIDLLGFAMIIATVVLLALPEKAAGEK